MTDVKNEFPTGPRGRVASASGARDRSGASVSNGASDGARSRFLSLSLLLCLVSLLFLSGCVNRAATSPSDIEPLFYDYWGPWAAGFYIPTLLVLSIIVLGWMYATAVRDDKLMGWCKNELLQLGFSVLILMVVLSVIANLSSAVIALSSVSPPGPEADSWKNYVAIRCAPTNQPLYDRPCHIRLSEDFLQILASASEEQARTVLNYNSILATVSSIGLSFRGMPDPSGYLDISPLAGLSVPLETLGFVFDMANKNLMAIRFQQTLMELLHLAFFPLFLTFGLFFRTMFFTRRLGGLLIAIALGAYIVLPMMYVFFHAMLFSFTGPWPTPGASEMDAYAEKVGGLLYRVDVDSGGTAQYPTQAVAGAGGYDEPAPSGGVKGQYSANGKIEPWEECNELADAIRTDTGKPNTLPFGCPPTDASGKILLGREKDYYCQYGNAVCNNDPTHGFGRAAGSPTRNAQGEYISPFGSRFVQSSTGAALSDPAFPENKVRGDIVAESARLGSRLCTPVKTTTEQEASKRLLLGAAKTSAQKLKEGFGGAFMVALAGNELLGFNGVIDNLAKIMIFSLLTPFISIMVMLAGIKVLSPSLGGDVDIAGLTKLI